MAIGLIATIKVQEGKNEAFEAAFLELARRVREDEPGNMLYALHRSTTDTQTYKVMEQYVDAAALKAHGETAHFVAAFQQVGALLAGAPEVEQLDVIG